MARKIAGPKRAPAEQPVAGKKVSRCAVKCYTLAFFRFMVSGISDKTIQELRGNGVISKSGGVGQALFSLEDACRVALWQRLAALGLRPQMRLELMADARRINWDEVGERPVALHLASHAEVALRLDAIRDSVVQRVERIFGGIYTAGQLEAMGIGLSSEGDQREKSLAEQDQGDLLADASNLLEEHEDLDEDSDPDANTEAAATSDEPATTDDEDDEWWLEDDLEALP